MQKIIASVEKKNVGHWGACLKLVKETDYACPSLYKISCTYQADRNNIILLGKKAFEVEEKQQHQVVAALQKEFDNWARTPGKRTIAVPGGVMKIKKHFAA